MKIFSAFLTSLGLLFIVKCPQILAENHPTYAISLRVLQKELKDCQQTNNCSEQHLHLGGFTRITGYVIDQDSSDIILFGQADSKMPPLHTEDFVVALRNSWRKYTEQKGNTIYYSYPGCTIDPDPRVMRQLVNLPQNNLSGSLNNQIQQKQEQWRRVCVQSQNVRVLGIPFDTRFAQIMVEADYEAKKLVGEPRQKDLSVPNKDSNLVQQCQILREMMQNIRNTKNDEELDFQKLHQALGTDLPSLTDIVQKNIQCDLYDNRSSFTSINSMSRFWFSPGRNIYKKGKGITVIEESSVILKTMEQYLSQNNLADVGKADLFADLFARNFTNQYANIANEQPIYQELENLFRFFALTQIIKYQNALTEADLELDYFLNQYIIPQASVTLQKPGYSSFATVKKSWRTETAYRQSIASLPSCGGVGIEIKPSTNNFVADNTGELDELTANILQSRSTTDTLFWEITSPEKSLELSPKIFENLPNESYDEQYKNHFLLNDI